MQQKIKERGEVAEQEMSLTPQEFAEKRATAAFAKIAPLTSQSIFNNR